MTGPYLVARVLDIKGFSFGSPAIIEASGPQEAARRYGTESGERLAVWNLGRHPMTFIIGAEPGVVHASGRL